MSEPTTGTPLLVDGSSATRGQLALGTALLALIQEHRSLAGGWCSCGWRRLDTDHVWHLSAVLGKRAAGVK